MDFTCTERASKAVKRGSRLTNADFARVGLLYSVFVDSSRSFPQLMILEIAGLLNPASSPLAWRACLGLMVLGLHVVLPFLLAFVCLGEIGFGR